jgi:hypothetical protein
MLRLARDAGVWLALVVVPVSAVPCGLAIRVLRRDRLGGIVHEYVQVA